MSPGRVPDAPLLSGEQAFGTAQVDGGAEQVEVGAVAQRAAIADAAPAIAGRP